MLSKKSLFILLLILVTVALGSCSLPAAQTRAAAPVPVAGESGPGAANVATLPVISVEQSGATTYPIIDTGQNGCYDDRAGATCPQPGQPFAGQDAQYAGLQPSYTDNGDGTITDLNTGLMWQKSPDLNHKSTFAAVVAGADSFNLAGYSDWRLPTIKELYSLTNFNGSQHTKTPYIDTEYFDFVFGDESAGERAIDAQYWSGTQYVGTVFGGQAAVFGVNFADGRIKGYPRDFGRGGSPMTQFVRYVRGNPGYGINNFADNGDSTISDAATGLTWMKNDSGSTMNWESALNYCENLNYAGRDDWRLPNAKELQSIVDYNRAPDAQNPAQQGPAIDPVFNLTDAESWYWTGTTLLESPPHVGSGSQAVYVTFGQAFGVYQSLLNVHGAGAQRSDPKSGDPAEWADGFGPQNDQIRINNYVRCVTGGGVAPTAGPNLTPTGSSGGGFFSGIFGGGEAGQPPAGGPPGNQGGSQNQPGAGQGQPPAGRTPPQEAVDACNGAAQGSSCQMNTPRGTLNGTCRMVPTQQLACVPEGGPPPPQQSR